MNAFNTWFEHARRGDRFLYYTGDLARDTFKGRTPWIIPIANRAWTLSEAGKVHLVQRRLKAHCYQYLAVRA
jgi:hypothetical protein